ncbi:nitroreductase family protein [Acholeplasma hippikon]|uniref:NAD(P)H nitroreductase yodC n=1 Tax=Acholeplasma hippikon TaxID=264636 RepID=A0A449BIU7_9MOLU|nr:nitroreductase family protein [Acholeplasma hippikon]VEU82391.1 Putative NAD(P)H nitroreductase yodC [Acholeplasma hippikon]
MKEIILNRRSIRKYTDFKISDEEILDIIDLAQKAPSTQNLQPWRFFVIGTPEGKEKLKKSMTYNLTQLETSSHMILLALDPMRHEKAEIIFNRAVLEGIMPIEVKERQLKHIAEKHATLEEPGHTNRLFLDAGLVAMNFMLAAKIHGYDTNPIGGFDKKTIMDNLGIKENLIPALLISIGKADEEGFKSVRLSAKETTQFIK